MSVDHEGLFIAAGAIGAKLAQVSWRIFSSGRIRSSDTDRLWAEAGNIRTSLNEEIKRLEQKLDSALIDNDRLVQSNTILAQANTALLATVDDLQQTNRSLVLANKSLERRVEELLTHLQESSSARVSASSGEREET